jgi:hypothetical protein
MDTFVCNICGIEFPKNEKANKYKRCVQCHRVKEKERRLLELETNLSIGVSHSASITLGCTFRIEQHMVQLC